MFTLYNATDFSCIFDGGLDYDLTLVLHDNLLSTVAEVSVWGTEDVAVAPYDRGLYEITRLRTIEGKVVVPRAVFTGGMIAVTSLRGIMPSAQAAKLLTAVPASAPFPSRWTDSFDYAGRTQGSLPLHFSDQGGVFEVVPAAQGRAGVLQQQVLHIHKVLFGLRQDILRSSLTVPPSCGTKRR